MPAAPTPLEPAIRDPRKLRKTAWILVGLMVVGGFMIHLAYEKSSKRQNEDGRPSIVARLTPEKDLRVLRQDGAQVDLLQNDGKVWVAAAISASQLETSARTLAVMKRLSEKYAGREDFVLVCLIIDSDDREKLDVLLTETAAKIGATLPQWWVASQQQETLHKFVKNEFKLSQFPHQENGKWVFDTSLVIVDRNRHVRQAVIPQKQGGPPFVARFDFDQAAGWDAKGIKSGTERTNAEELELRLIETIETVLAEPKESK
jgi:cytochrome oxidase Cu insertion factor (SCO1/SenC/PrrC family)